VMSEAGFCDLKTCRNIQAFAFGKSFFEYGYDISLGLYQRWLSRARNQPEPCYVVAVESSEPFDVAVIPVPQAVLDRGVERSLSIIEKYVQCKECGEWPGIANGEEYYLHVPYYELRDDDELDMEGV